MKILDKIKAMLPVSRAFHKAEIDRIHEQQRKAFGEREREYLRKEEKITETVRELTRNLSSIEFIRKPHGDLAVQMNVSGDMIMRASVDPDQRKMIANLLGRQFAAEIERSKFVASNY